MQRVLHGRAVQPEKVPRSERKQQQMEGVVAKETPEVHQVGQRQMSVHDKEDRQQIEGAHRPVLPFSRLHKGASFLSVPAYYNIFLPVGKVCLF